MARAEYVNSITKGNVTKEIHDNRIPDFGKPDKYKVLQLLPESSSITSNAVANWVTPTDMLTADSVTTAKIATGAVTTPKIAADSISTLKIKDSAITKAKISDDIGGGIADHVVNVSCDSDGYEYTNIVVEQDAATLLSWFTNPNESVVVRLSVTEGENNDNIFILPKVRIYNEGAGGQIDCDFVLASSLGLGKLQVLFMADRDDSGAIEDDEWYVRVRSENYKITTGDIADSCIDSSKIDKVGAISSASQGDNLALFDSSNHKLKKSVAFDGNNNSVLHGDGRFYGNVVCAFDTTHDITVDSYVAEPTSPNVIEGQLSQGSYDKLSVTTSPAIIVDDGLVFRTDHSTGPVRYYFCIDKNSDGEMEFQCIGEVDSSNSNMYTRGSRLTIAPDDTFALRTLDVYQHYITAVTDIGEFHFSTFLPTSAAINIDSSSIAINTLFWLYVLSEPNTKPTADTPIPCTGYGYDSDGHAYSQFIDFYYEDSSLYLTALVHFLDSGTMSKRERKATLQSVKSFPCKFVRL